MATMTGIISTIDLQGLALVAIQGLDEKLISGNTRLRKVLKGVEARLAVLESQCLSAG